jgi:hypothetical protein
MNDIRRVETANPETIMITTQEMASRFNALRVARDNTLAAIFSNDAGRVAAAEIVQQAARMAVEAGMKEMAA